MNSTDLTTAVLEHDRIQFPKLGIDITVHDTAFTVFGIEVKWYGLIIVTGIFLAMLYCFPQMKKYGLDYNRAFDAIFGGIIGGVIGARAYYVIMSWDSYVGDWKSIFNFRNGGLAIYGGIIGAILVGGIVAKIRKVKFLPLLDISSIGFLIGQSIGRWGNFTNQEAFGCNTDSVFGMTGGRIQEYLLSGNATLSGSATIDPFKPVHPCFLYESFWCLLGFLLLAVFAKKIRKYDGQIFLMYVCWYGIGRFFIEGLRTDSLMIGQLRASQALAAVCVVASVILQIVIGSKVKRMGEDYQMYYQTEESKTLLAEAENYKNDKKASEEDDTEASEENEETSNDSGIISEDDSSDENGTEEK